MSIPENHSRCRYVERWGAWTLTVYSVREAGAPPSLSSDDLRHRPQWLIDILATAAIAGQYQHVPYPPPDIIVWFDLGENNEFVGFPHKPTNTTGPADEHV